MRRKVQKGTGIGKKINYPTLNFRIGDFKKCYNEGVYKCEVFIDNKCYNGALYFGPRLSNKKKVLELHVVKFDKDIYGKFINFKILNKIREPKLFKSLDKLKKQITDDLKQV